jgi:hypothetical protein
MRRIRQVLQLHFDAQASARTIAGTLGVGRSTVQDYVARAAASGLVWPLAPELTDDELEQMLFPAPRGKPGARLHVEPDWSALVREMKRPGKRGKSVGSPSFFPCADSPSWILRIMCRRSPPFPR